MNGRDATVFGTGFALLGIASALSAPDLPLRVSLPMAGVLGLVGAAWRRKRGSQYAGFALGYAALWMVGCVIDGGAGFDKPSAVGALLLSLIVLSLLAYKGLNAVRRGPSGFDFGVIGGIVVLGWFMSAMAARGRAISGADDPLVVDLVGGLVAWLAVRAAMGSESIARGAVLPVLGLAFCGCLAGPVGWGLAAMRARTGEAGPSRVTAYRLTCEEEDRARRLDLRWAMRDALERQTRIAGYCGNADLCRTKTWEIVRLNPGDRQGWLWLFRDGLIQKDYGQAVEALKHLSDLPLSIRTAERLARVCWQAGDLDGFLAVWRGCQGGIAFLQRDKAAWVGFGERCYFGGRREEARALLSLAQAEGALEWPAARMLWSLHVDAGNAAGAAKLLDPAFVAEENREEAEFLQAETRERLKGKKAAPLELADGRIVATNVAAGGGVKVRFLWRAFKPVDPAWTVCVHVRQRAYQGCFYQTKAGFEELGRKPRTWALGTDLLCEMTVKIPESAAVGEYAVLVGVEKDGKAQPVVMVAGGGGKSSKGEEAGRIPLGVVRVRAVR